MLVKKSSFLISGNDSLNDIDIVQRILLEHYQISIFSYLECARNTSLAVLVAENHTASLDMPNAWFMRISVAKLSLITVTAWDHPVGRNQWRRK